MRARAGRSRERMSRRNGGGLARAGERIADVRVQSDRWTDHVHGRGWGRDRGGRGEWDGVRAQREERRDASRGGERIRGDHVARVDDGRRGRGGGEGSFSCG